MPLFKDNVVKKVPVYLINDRKFAIYKKNFQTYIYEVLPLKWYVDKRFEGERLVCMTTLFDFEDVNFYRMVFDIDMYNYLNDTFVKYFQDKAIIPINENELEFVETQNSENIYEEITEMAIYENTSELINEKLEILDDIKTHHNNMDIKKIHTIRKFLVDTYKLYQTNYDLFDEESKKKIVYLLNSSLDSIDIEYIDESLRLVTHNYYLVKGYVDDILVFTRQLKK